MGSACGITSATLNYTRLVRAVSVASFNSRCSKSNLDLLELPLGRNWLRSAEIVFDTAMEKTPLEEVNLALPSHLPFLLSLPQLTLGQTKLLPRT